MSDLTPGLNAEMKVTVTSPVLHLCPYRDEEDEGTVELTFTVDDGDAPELHDLATDLLWATNERVSHEEFTRKTLYITGAQRAVSHWRTAGMDVTCDLSRESDR